MPDNGVLVNTARKEVIHEEELMQIMESKPKFQYLTDVAPEAAALFQEKFPGRYFGTPKRWVPRRKRLISTRVSLLQNRFVISSKKGMSGLK
jgi:lactate dehydrogenase-like 2-hydroxyacid dehydrogenase